MLKAFLHLTAIFCFSLFCSLYSSEALSALCVSNSYANLRKGPGIGHQKTWQVFRYMPLEKLKKADGWYQVKDLDSNIHWIREDLVTSRFQCAVIKNEFAHLRTGPGTQYPKTKAKKGVKYLSFRVMKIQGDWVKVEDGEGDEAWIHKPLLWIK